GACSSSLIAVTTAATALSNGVLDLAIAGGIDISLDTFELIGFAKTNALTREDMGVYDRGASGFIPGEGSGFVVLKRLQDAYADGNYVYSVLRGWGMSSDGKGGLTAPKAQTQALAIRRAYGKADYGLREVNFIEGHGTGTIAGDIAELEGIALAMDSGTTDSLRPCGITSLKSLIGHTKAASGIGGFIKAVMAVNRRVIPPTAGCTDPNPVFQEKARRVYPVLQGEIRGADDTIRAGISGMGFGGINCHVTIESAGESAENIEPPIGERELLASYQETELFVLSAESQHHMIERVHYLKNLVEGISIGEMVDLSSYLTGDISADKPFRMALIAASPEGLIACLDHAAQMLSTNDIPKGEMMSGPQQDIWVGHSASGNRIGFLFPGQGSQQLNMGRLLVERYPWARDFSDRVESWLSEAGQEKMRERIYRPLDRALNSDQIDAWKKALSRSEIAQPAICMTSLLWIQHLEKLGISPVAAGGHSLGELTAFHAAGAFDEEVLLRFAAIRGSVTAAPEDNPGVMASFACGREQVEELLKEIGDYAVVANINSPMQTVISGERRAVEKAVQLAARSDITTTYLPVSHAFHSRFMTDAADRLSKEAPIPETLKRTKIKLFTSMDGREVTAGTDLRRHFARQVTNQVDFISLIHTMRRECDLLVEVGPGRVLSDLVKSIAGTDGTVCLPVESRAGDDRSLNVFLGCYFAHGGEIHWPALFENRLVRSFIPASKRVFIDNPCERPFNESLEEVQQTIPRNVGALESALAHAADLPSEVISDYLARRAPFLGAVIKADLEHSAPQVQDAMGVLPLPDPHEIKVPAKASPEEKETLPAHDIGDNTASISDMLLELVEKRTGFPRETLSLEFRLLDDLNLDSIKAAELIAAVSMRLGLAGNINAAQFANARLSEIAATLARLGKEGEKQAEEKPETAAPAHSEKTWVRNFIVQYVPEPLPVRSTTHQDATWDASRVLIMSDESESVLARTLKSELAANGAEAQTLFFSEALGLLEKDIPFTHYITILPRTANDGLSQDARFPAMVERLRTAVILQSAARAHRSNTALVYVQFGEGRFGAEMQDGDIEQCCATAFAASVHHERPELKVRVVDFSSRVSPDIVSRCLIHELSTPERYSAAGYDANTVRRVPRPRMQEPASDEKRSIKWTSDDIVLVTGGAKGITAECALAFARATGVRMILVGSSPHPDEGGQERNSTIAAVLDRFSSEGLFGRYYRCDITDAESVDRLIGQVRQEIGPITGVIHGAGLNWPNRTEIVSSEEALKEIGPKVYGAMNLCKALNDVPPKMFVGFTSIIGVTGMPGNAWYAFSNEALDVLLGKFEKENPMSSVLSLAFSIWEEVGMGARMGSLQVLANKGIGAIPTGEGIQRFLHLLLNKPEARQVIVAARLGGLDTWNPERHAVPASRFLENIVTIEPNVEVVSRAHLTLERDPYIKDHLWRGTYLFPTVFGLEAMSQAVSAVTGKNNFDTLRIENIRLERPITIFPDNGCTIEIHAEALEKESDGAPQRVTAGIRSEQTGSSEDHFSATFILGEKMEAPVEHIRLLEKPLDIDPKRDLYGDVLFQGALFQRIQQIYSLNSKQCIFLSERDLEHEAPSKNERNSWLLGDPFFRDSLLHSAQLPLSPDICLPLRIGSIERYPVKQSSNPSLTGVVVIENRVGNEYHATVSALDQNGHVVERITGYVLKIMEHQADYPTPEEFADPGKRDENILRMELDRRVHQFDVMMPELVSTHMPGIHQVAKRDRHEQEVPFLQEAVRRALKHTDYVSEEVRITWLESGKPSFEGAADTGLDISLSHNEGTMLCVSGSGPQGCDIESITRRSHDEWIALIGKARESIFQQLIEGNDSPDWAGTRIWVASEAVHKATASVISELAIEKRDGNSVLFRSNFSDKNQFILSFPVTLTRGPERMIALVVQPVNNKQSVAHDRQVNVHAERLNFNFESHKVDIATGPQDQPCFLFRFPVTIKEASNPSGTLYFSHYFAWMSKLREYSIQPVYKDTAKLLATGKWGLMTNHAETHIRSEAKPGDIIEGRVSFDRISGKDNSTVDMRFEWWKTTDDEKRELISFSTMSITWVAIHDSGVAEVQPLPEFIEEFLRKMTPSSDVHEGRHESFETGPPFDFGQELYQEPAGPIQPAALLKERIFETTLEDATLMANIHFSSYYLWQGRVRDHYVNEMAPEYFNGSGKQGELRCMRCKVNHISEAMPFERIAVRMYRTAIYERGIRFYFDYYRIGLDGARKKLGYGEHEAAWFAPTEENTWLPSELPKTILDALMPEKTSVNLELFSTPQTRQSGKYDVVVVGSGIGGLSAAALLAKQGKRVLVIEQHDKPGGFCTSWERFVQLNGKKLRFIFEAGVHDIANFGGYSNTSDILRSLDVADRIEWRRVDHEYILPGFRLKVPRELADYVGILCEQFPKESTGLLSFFKEVRACFEEIYSLKSLRNENKGLAIDKWQNVSLSSMLDTYIRDEQLKTLLSILAYYIADEPSHLNALTAIPCFGYYIGGGHYPAGGSQVLSDTLVSAIMVNGGEVRLRSLVSNIIVEDGHVTGVKLTSNEVIHADFVISNADIHRTFLELVGRKHLQPHFWRRIEKLRPSNSAFMVSLGVNFIPEVNPATFLVDESGLLAIMVPSKVDTSLAPQSYSCITLIMLLPHEQSVVWDRNDPAYREQKERYGDALIERAEKAIPKLREHIIYRQDASPATFARYARTTDGSIYGLAADEWKPSIKTPIKGLYLSSAGASVRPGVEDAVYSGRMAAEAILKNEGNTILKTVVEPRLRSI
ncbi:MAG TPA: hypothetical protein DCO77_01850, partial [Nitrospiraceae bacterium]|nr:hypothetical protein [Nitrospiraceae bacterium]